MTHVAIVILNYNGKGYLKQFLPILMQHADGHEVIVADNNSTDDSMVFVKMSFPEIRTLEFDQNYGFAGGYNLALRQIDASYYLIINSDIEVTPGWLSPLIDFLDHHPTHAGCQPKIRNQRTRSLFEYAGAAGGFIDPFGYPFCRGRIFDNLEEDNGQYDDEKKVFWATGACLCIRSDDFHRVGGFDEDFFAHMEEIDLCWRLYNLNREFACVPASLVYHVGGGTLAKSNPSKTYLNFRNGLTLLLKNLVWYHLWKIPIRMLMDLMAGLKFWKENDIGHFIAVLRAHIMFILNIRRNMAKRSRIPHQLLSKDLLPSRSIVWDRFVKGRIKFSDLDQ